MPMGRLLHTKPPLLSKSRFLAGLQCPLRLWYQCYEPQLASKMGPAQQAVLETGHAVGRLATGRYPGGTLIREDHHHHASAVRTTAVALKTPGTPSVYEAAFTFDDIRVRADVLERKGSDRWNLVEVKSAATVKDVYVWDVALQHYVLQGSGLNIDRVGLLRINNRYVHQGGAPVLDELFCFDDLTLQSRSRQEEVRAHLRSLRQMLDKEHPPDIPPSRHCKNPYLCEFWEHCTDKMPEFWVLQLSGITQGRLDELSRLGITDIRDVPVRFPLTELQQRIRTCARSRTEYLSPTLIGELEQLELPIHFLDFETIAPAVPRYPATRPYQTLAFQFSDHILRADGSMDHREYLCREDKDPRFDFTGALIETLGTRGSIVIYTTYEKEIIRALAEHYPEMQKSLDSIVGRLKDLHAMIRKHYYHPDFKGSFSLKSVLPALLPELSYENLDIQEGSQASLAYLRMISAETSAREKAEIERDLLAYCSQDTLAMVRIREELLDRSRKLHPPVR